jgi:hypothetical protein
VLDVEALVDVEGEEDLISFRDLLRWLHEGRRWVTLADGSVAKLDPKILQPVAEAAGDIEFDKQGHAEVSTLELGNLSRLLCAVPTAEVAKEVRGSCQEHDRREGRQGAAQGQGAHRQAARVSAVGLRVAVAAPREPHDRDPRRRHGPRQDRAGPGLLTKAKEVEGQAPSLIVCPTSVLSVWKQEVKKWAPSLSVLTWHGTDRGENRRLLKKSDIVVTSYALCVATSTSCPRSASAT